MFVLVSLQEPQILGNTIISELTIVTKTKLTDRSNLPDSSICPEFYSGEGQPAHRPTENMILLFHFGFLNSKRVEILIYQLHGEIEYLFTIRVSIARMVAYAILLFTYYLFRFFVL